MFATEDDFAGILKGFHSPGDGDPVGAGAILMGKTNTSEFTLTYDTDNLVYGRTKN